MPSRRNPANGSVKHYAMVWISCWGSAVQGAWKWPRTVFPKRRCRSKSRGQTLKSPVSEKYGTCTTQGGSYQVLRFTLKWSSVLSKSHNQWTLSRITSRFSQPADSSSSCDGSTTPFGANFVNLDVLPTSRESGISCHATPHDGQKKINSMVIRALTHTSAPPPGHTGHPSTAHSTVLII